MSMFAHPHVSIEDSHGHSFNTDVRGGTESWHANFQLNLWSNSISDAVEEKAERFRKEHLEMQPGDFQLIITNPDLREGQPRAVSIQLP